MKIATWNINSINSRVQQVVDWWGINKPDVLCLQETKCTDEKFPHQRLRSSGFEHIAFHGEKAYNGVAILSKYPLDDLQKNFPGDAADAPRRLIAATVEGIRIINVYVPHGTSAGSDKFTFKLDWVARLNQYFTKYHTLDENILLCGDLNIAPHESDVWNVPYWKDRMHFTKPERDAIRELKQWGFVDVFRQNNDEPGEYSWWDQYHHAFEKNQGLRIDHIWTTPPLADLCTDCWIDREPRALERPSDHAPVVAEFQT
ncbi:MAG: exodeoxyribonuclease III [Pyrinomonadaceae bacterium]